MGIVHATACAEPPPATRLLAHRVVDLAHIMRLMPVKRNDGNRMAVGPFRAGSHDGTRGFPAGIEAGGFTSP